MTITNAALAAKLQDVTDGYQSFVAQQISWLVSTGPTINLTDPYNPLVSVIVKTLPKLVADYENLVAPATGLIAQTQAQLDAANTALAGAVAAQATFNSYNTTFVGYVAEADADRVAAQAARDAAETFKNQAATSASGASSSASSASTSASTATTKASEASTSASAALAARVAAEAARDAAIAAGYNSASVAITGGTINGTSIGATTQASGAFTSLSSTLGATFASASGVVGIGGVNSGALGRLEVQGAGYQASVVRSTTASGVSAVVVANSASEARFGTVSNHPVWMLVNNTSVGVWSATGLSITGTLNTTGALTTTGGIWDQIWDGSGALIRATSYTSSSATASNTINLRRARGTLAAPTAILSGDRLSAIQANGHDGSIFRVAAQLLTEAVENFSGSAAGTRIRVLTVPAGSTALTEVASFQAGVGSTFTGVTRLNGVGTGSIYAGSSPTSSDTPGSALTNGFHFGFVSNQTGYPNNNFGGIFGHYDANGSSGPTPQYAYQIFKGPNDQNLYFRSGGASANTWATWKTFVLAEQSNGNVSITGSLFTAGVHEVTTGSITTRLQSSTGDSRGYVGTMTNHNFGLLRNGILMVDIGSSKATFNVPVDARRIFLERINTSVSGVSFYQDSYSAWQLYMSPAGASTSGANGTLTAPSGSIVTSWALRSVVEPSAGYGWTWEAVSALGTTPSVLMELSSQTGNLRTVGTVRSAVGFTYDSEVNHGIHGSGGSGTQNINWATGHRGVLTLNATATGVTTTITFNTPGMPCNLVLKVRTSSTQGANQQISWPASIKWAGGTTAPDHRTGNNKTHLYFFYFDGTEYFGSAVLNYGG